MKPRHVIFSGIILWSSAVYQMPFGGLPKSCCICDISIIIKPFKTQCLNKLAKIKLKNIDPYQHYWVLKYTYWLMRQAFISYPSMLVYCFKLSSIFSFVIFNLVGFSVEETCSCFYMIKQLLLSWNLNHFKQIYLFYTP